MTLLLLLVTVPLVVTVLVLVLVVVLVELTVLVLVELLLVSTSVELSYTVCADTLKIASVAASAIEFLFNMAPFLFIIILANARTGH